MPEPRIDKCHTFYELAKNNNEGVIVELGTYLGIGVSALSFGAHDGYDWDVFTIDSYTRKHGWAGEEYTHEDKAAFLDNMLKLKEKFGLMPFLVVGQFNQVAHTWIPKLNVGLLIWDGGVADVYESFISWERYVEIGSKVAFHDTRDGYFGIKKLCDDLVNSGKFAEYQKMRGDVHVITRVSVWGDDE